MASIWSSININVTSSVTNSISSISKVVDIRLWNPTRQNGKRRIRTSGNGWVKVRAAKVKEKPEICSADELHYIRVPNTIWKLALWRYLPSHYAATMRKHPVLMLSGVGTNAIVYDLSPQFSFARYMSGQGFDTWILEVRGAGLSIRESQSQIVPMIDDFQRQLDLFLNTNWDFDQLLKEDLPLVVDYIITQSQSSDGKLFGIGHSLGGILLYSMLSLCGLEGRDSNFAAIATLASTLDFSSSNSSFKLLLPLADSAKALNIPSIPIGTLLSMVHPIALRPPFLPSWLNSQISVQE